MSESISMTDEEFMAFINANKERMNTLMGDDKDVKAFIKDNAKKAKAKVEKAGDAVEGTVKKVFDAIFSPEVQKQVLEEWISTIWRKTLKRPIPVWKRISSRQSSEAQKEGCAVRPLRI